MSYLNFSRSQSPFNKNQILPPVSKYKKVFHINQVRHTLRTRVLVNTCYIYFT